MDKKDLKRLEAMNKAEKVTKALDRGVDMADEKLSQVPSMMGKHKPKIMLAVVLSLVIAFLRDPTLALILALILVVLYSSVILSKLKEQMLKQAAKKEVSKISEVTPKEEVKVTVFEVKKED